MRLIGHTPGAYEGHKQRFDERQTSPLDRAYLEIQQTRAMLDLIRHACQHPTAGKEAKALYDNSGFAEIARQLEDMMPEYREGNARVIAHSIQSLEKAPHTKLLARETERIAAAYDKILVDAYHSTMTQVCCEINDVAHKTSEEKLPEAVRNAGWLKSAQYHAAQAFDYLQQAKQEREQTPEKRAASL